MRRYFSLPIVAFLILELFFLSACTKERKIMIFGHKVALGKPIERFGHERPFVDLIEVDELNYNSADGLTRAEMAECVSALMSKTQPNTTLEGAIQVFVFTTDEDATQTTISLNRTHAFSVLTLRDDLLEHHYFERRGSSAFRKVPSLSMVLPSPLDLDDIRLLHFAGAGKYELPSKSTIYEFNSGSWGANDWVWEKNIPLRISLILDQDRNWGVSTLGLYGDEIYLAFLDASGSFCGGNGKCPEGTDSCGMPPGGPDPVCGAVGGDVGVDISRALRDEGIDTPVPIDFVLLRALRKDILVRYEKGRDYLSYYYAAALFTRLDRQLLEKYVEAIPYVDKAIRELLYGSDETVIVTTALRDSMLGIIENHRGIQNQAFQEILDIIEGDLRSYHGMTRGQLVDALSQ